MAIVVFSWGVRENNEPNPCSLRLAEEVIKIKTKYENCFEFEVRIFCQMEVGLALRALGVDEKLILKESFDDKFDETGKKLFLDTNLVWEELCPEIGSYGADFVIVVCQQFLQKHKAMALLKSSKKAGRLKANILKEKIGRIGFDPENDQWQCRSWWQALMYAIMQVFSLKRPKWLK